MPRVFAPAILSSLLLWAAFFPLDLGAIGFVALAPWLTLIRAPVSRRRRYFAAYVGGFAFYALAVNWVRVAHPMMYMSWLGLSLVLPLFWLLGLDLIRRADRLGVPLALSVPVTWVALEYARMHFPTGFPFLKPLGIYQMIGFGWYFLGYTQHAFLPLIQIADIGGVYAVSFLVAAVNGAVADALMRSERVRRWLRWPSSENVLVSSRPRIIASGVGAAATFVAFLAYGFIQLDHAPFAEGPRVAALQGNIPQGQKMLKGDDLDAAYGKIYREALEQEPRPDLVIWPETCFSYDWCEVVQGQPSVEFAREVDFSKRLFREMPACFEFTEASFATLRKAEVPESMIAKLLPQRGKLLAWTEFVDMLSKTLTNDERKLTNKYGKRCWDAILVAAYSPIRVPVLLGLTGREWENGKESKYNSALLMSAEGAKVGRYDKMHLVPFGEYVPLKEWLPFMQVFTPYKEDYSCRPGEHWTRFPLSGADQRRYTFACLICYEDSDPYLARQYVASDPVNFLVNISNDGWFDGTEEHEQHLAICRFRAVEARRSVVRAVNMGISAVIDSDGRVIALPGAGWSDSKKVEGVVAAAPPIDDRVSWYSRLGDWVPAACWGVAAAVLLLSFRR